FGPAEYFSLMVFGLVGSSVLAQGSLLRAFGAIFIGLLMAMVGTDLSSTFQRFTFGVQDLFDGLGFVPVSMGLFGLAEILMRVQAKDAAKGVTQRVGRLRISREDWSRAWRPIVRGTFIGSALGI